MKTHLATESRPKRVYCLILILLLPPSISFGGQFEVTRIYDGDTIKAEGHDIEIKVRLVGIDAPETSRNKRDPGQPYSQHPTKYLASLILNKLVEIKDYGLDRYNPALGVIYMEWKNVNFVMVGAGLAEVYRGRPPKDFGVEPYFQADKEVTEAEKGHLEPGE